MAWCMLAAGFCFLVPKENSAKVTLIVFFVYLFGAFYDPGKCYRLTAIANRRADSLQALDQSHLSTSQNRSLCPIAKSVLLSQSASTTQSAALSVSHSPLSWPRSRRQVHSVCMPASTYCHSWSSSSWYRRPSKEHLRTLMSSSVSRQLDMHRTRVRFGYRVGSSAISSCRRLRLWGGS
jgi:hypothetical protein